VIAIIAAIVAMAVKDALCTFLTVAEAKGRAWLAGMLDAGNDIAGIVCTVVGAGSIIQQGVNGHTILILAAMTLTSLFGTTLWTKLGRRIGAHEDEIVVDG